MAKIILSLKNFENLRISNDEYEDHEFEEGSLHNFHTYMVDVGLKVLDLMSEIQ